MNLLALTAALFAFESADTVPGELSEKKQIAEVSLTSGRISHVGIESIRLYSLGQGSEILVAFKEWGTTTVFRSDSTELDLIADSSPFTFARQDAFRERAIIELAASVDADLSDAAIEFKKTQSEFAYVAFMIRLEKEIMRLPIKGGSLQKSNKSLNPTSDP